MIKQIEKKEEFRLANVPQELIARGREMVGIGRDVWLAGLGAVATVEEEGTAYFETLVTKGKKVEDAGKKRLDAVKEEITERQQAVTTVVEDNVYAPILNALKRFGVPTRGEIHDLSGKVDALTKHVDVLVGKLGKAAKPVEPVVVFYVTAQDDKWIIGKEGLPAPVDVYPTKEAALEAARALANENMPSRLHVYKKDGSIQDTFNYEA